MSFMIRGVFMTLKLQIKYLSNKKIIKKQDDKL